MDTYPLIIDGEERASRSGEYFATADPATGKELASVARGGGADIDDAVNAARRASESTWRSMPPAERGRLLLEMARRLTAESSRLASLETADSGKPISQAMNDVLVAARYFEWYGGLADKLFGTTIPIASDLFAFTVREPYGVTGHIVPWNYPIQIAARTVAPSLAAGNCVVLKPAELTPITAVELGRIARSVGFPPGVLNVVPGYGAEAGHALASHPGIAHLAFTGSPEVGRSVMIAAAQNVVPVALELGGKSPHIVMPDADLSQVAPVVVRALIQNAGQTCSAGSRVIVHRTIHDQLMDLLQDAFSKVTIGPGAGDPDLGPLISNEQRERVQRYIDVGVTQGGELVFGGGVPKGTPAGGTFVEPTILTRVDRSHIIANEEVFGPVLAVLTFDNPTQAVEIANSTRFGLVSAVWTKDIDTALNLASGLRCGQVYINTYGAGGGVELPFGGYKESGFGREKGVEGILQYTQIKTVAAKLDPLNGATHSG